MSEVSIHLRVLAFILSAHAAFSGLVPSLGASWLSVLIAMWRLTHTWAASAATIRGIIAWGLAFLEGPHLLTVAAYIGLLAFMATSARYGGEHRLSWASLADSVAPIGRPQQCP